jgi:predicted amidohydrolase YtcJ
VVRRAAYAAVSPAQRRAAQTATLDRAAVLGIGCVHECGGPDIGGEDDFTALLALEHGVERLGYWGELDATDRARELGAVGAGGDLFADGALGSHTACLGRPTPTSDAGPRLPVRDEVARHVTACTRAGLQAGFHAIGDAALTAVLDGVGAAAEEVGLEAVRAARHRVEHAEMLDADGVARMAAYGLVASVQPAFDARWGGEHGMYAERLGAERARGLNPYAALAAAGVAVALGSDAPVTPLDPWGTLRAAVLHRTPGSGLSARAAFSAHTRGGWRAARRDEAGELVPGAPASFAVWQVTGELVVQVPDARVSAWSTDPAPASPACPTCPGTTPAAGPRWSPARSSTTTACTGPAEPGGGQAADLRGCSRPRIRPTSAPSGRTPADLRRRRKPQVSGGLTRSGARSVGCRRSHRRERLAPLPAKPPVLGVGPGSRPLPDDNQQQDAGCGTGVPACMRRVRLGRRSEVQ